MSAGQTLRDFRNSVQNLARPNRFIVTLPQGSADGTVLNSYTVKAAQLPGRTIGDIANLFWFGMNLKIASGDMIYDDFTLTFYNDAYLQGNLTNPSFHARTLLENWMNMIADPTSNLRSSSQLIKRPIRIDQYDFSSNTIMATYYLHGAYPKAIDPVEVSQDATDTAEEFGATFGYDYWSDGQSGAGETGGLALYVGGV